MKMHWSWIFCIGLLGMSGVLPIPGSASAQEFDDPRVEKVFSDWTKRQGRTKSVLYQLRGEVVIAKGSFPDRMGRPRPDAPPRDIVYPTKRSLLLDFVGNRYREVVDEEKYHEETAKLYPTFSLHVFDGQAIKSYRPRERNTHPADGVGPNDPEVGIGTGYLKNASFTVDTWPLFGGHGSVLSYYSRASPGTLKVLPDSELMYVHGQGVYQGRPCLVLRTHTRLQSFEEWWVDTAKDSAIARYLLYLYGKPLYDTEIEHAKTAHGWLPKRWTFTQRDVHSGQTLVVERLVVETLALDPEVSESDFQIDEKPGMLVIHVNHEAPKPGHFIEPEPKSKLFRVEEGGRHQEVEFQDGVERPVRSFRWWWLLALLPVFGLSAWLIRRWRMTRRRATP